MILLAPIIMQIPQCLLITGTLSNDFTFCMVQFFCFTVPIGAVVFRDSIANFARPQQAGAKSPEEAVRAAPDAPGLAPCSAPFPGTASRRRRRRRDGNERPIDAVIPSDFSPSAPASSAAFRLALNRSSRFCRAASASAARLASSPSFEWLSSAGEMAPEPPRPSPRPRRRTRSCGAAPAATVVQRRVGVVDLPQSFLGFGLG